MKKYIFAASLVANLSLIFLFFNNFLLRNEELVRMDSISPQVATLAPTPRLRSTGTTNGHERMAAKTFNIAILTPVSHPSLEQIQQSFEKTLQEKGVCKYRFKEFNGNGNRILMRSQAEEIVNGGYDLVFAIAAAPCLLVKEIMQKKGKSTPVVFGAISDPVGLGLVKSFDVPGGFVTGSVEPTAYNEQLNLLKQLKPNMQKMILIYNPAQGRGLEIDKKEVENICNELQIQLLPIEVGSVGEIYGKLNAFINGVDVVLVLKDNTVVSGIDAVIKLCNQHHVTLMCTDLDSSKKGAALSFGVYESEFGVKSALLAAQILEANERPSRLACLTPTNFRLIVNSAAIRSQGLNISQDLINLIKKVDVI